MIHYYTSHNVTSCIHVYYVSHTHARINLPKQTHDTFIPNNTSQDHEICSLRVPGYYMSDSGWYKVTKEYMMKAPWDNAHVCVAEN